ncbi:MAG: carboxypeptidase regulatory-like domain-containing protein, partial [Candidatus Chisholmbacteria bacterium]|nr:carboxypeptidase regulatory-like domain-containing protein [Candidatus Chisholmbacteria bacterium]
MNQQCGAVSGVCCQHWETCGSAPTPPPAPPPPTCGNGNIDAGEDCANCSVDVGACPAAPVGCEICGDSAGGACGDGTCGAGEGSWNCCSDCGSKSCSSGGGGGPACKEEGQSCGNSAIPCCGDLQCRDDAANAGGRVTCQSPICQVQWFYAFQEPKTFGYWVDEFSMTVGEEVDLEAAVVKAADNAFPVRAHYNLTDGSKADIILDGVNVGDEANDLTPPYLVTLVAQQTGNFSLRVTMTYAAYQGSYFEYSCDEPVRVTVGEPTGISGTFFDAGAGGTCSNLTPPIEGVEVTVRRAGGGAMCFSQTTDATGLYAGSCQGNATWEVVINSAPGGYSTTPTLLCNGSSVFLAPGQVARLDFGLTKGEASWFQLEGSGGLQALGSLANPIPSSCTGACTRSLVKLVSGQDPGVMAYGSGVSLGSGTVTSDPTKQWLVNSAFSGKRFDYDLYFNQLGFREASESDFDVGELINLPKPPAKSDGAYLARGDTRIQGGWNVSAGETSVVLVDGDLSLEDDMQVASGGFVAFLVKGNISVDPAVANLEGVY